MLKMLFPFITLKYSSTKCTNIRSRHRLALALLLIVVVIYSIVRRQKWSAGQSVDFREVYSGVVVNALVAINEVAPRRARLLLGWVTVCG